MDELEQLAAAAREHDAPQAGRYAYGYPPCIVCGYRGKPHRTSQNNGVVTACLAVLTLLLGYFSSWLLGTVFFIVLIVYVAFTSGEVWRCGHCGAKKADA